MDTKNDQLIRQVSPGQIESEISAFLIDRQARGLSACTLEFYRDELGHWQRWIAGQGIADCAKITAHRRRCTSRERFLAAQAGS